MKYRFELEHNERDGFDKPVRNAIEGEETVYDSLGETVLSRLEEILNKFLHLIGYDFTKDRVILESVTDDEYDYLIGQLDEYRNDPNNNI